MNRQITALTLLALLLLSMVSPIIPIPAIALESSLSWSSTTSLSPESGQLQTGSFAYQNRIYQVSGVNTSLSNYFTPEVRFAPIRSDGSLGYWTSTTPLPEPRSLPGVVLYGNRVYVIGGNGGGYQRNTVWYASINADGTLTGWTDGAPLPHNLQGHQTVVVGNRIYVMGGYDGYSKQDTVYYATINSDGSLSSWSTTTPIPQALTQGAAVTYNSRIYFIGGQSQGGSAPPTSTVFTAQVNPDGTIASWSTTLDLPQARWTHRAVLVGDTIYVIGGCTDLYGCPYTSVTDSVVKAKIQSDGALASWDSYANLPQPKSDPGVSATGFSIYVLGGVTNGGVITNSVYFATVTSAGTSWTKYPLNPILQPGPSSWDAFEVSGETVIKTGSGYYMYYDGRSSSGTSHYAIGLANSTDGKSWAKYGGGANPVLDAGPAGAWDSLYVTNPSVIRDGTGYKLYYNGGDGVSWKIGLATSSNGVNWLKQPNPVLDAGAAGEWDSGGVGSPSVIKDGSTYKMWYQGRDIGGSASKFGYATSDDGITWSKYAGPVLTLGPSGFWDASAPGLESPSVVKDGSVYRIWYDVAGTTTIGYATSNDGVTWNKFNQPVLTPTAGSWDSGIVMVSAVILDGSEYKMYYTGRVPGVGNAIGLATSPRPLADVLLMAQFPSDYDSSSMIVQAINDAGLTFEAKLWSDTGRHVPDPSSYKVVFLTDPGGSLAADVPVLRSYVQNGGGLVFIAGAAYWLPADPSWNGFSSVGYTGTETATVSVNNPLGTSLQAGDVLKVMPPGSWGAQWVDGLQSGATKIAGWSGGTVFAYSYQSGSGRVYYQADRSPELAGQTGYDRLRTLLSAGIRYASWSVTTVDSVGNVGGYPSLAFDAQGKPAISYYDGLNYYLKYAHWTGSSWNIETVDTQAAAESSTSLAFDPIGNPGISYYNVANNALKYAHWTGLSWNIETVDTGGEAGRFSSLAFDNLGYPAISYHDNTGDDLKFAHWTGSSWSIEIVDSAGDVGGENSLALDPSGNPAISYSDWTNHDLKYAHWNGASWDLEVVDSSGYSGAFTSLAFDGNGRPGISYHDGSSYLPSNQDLKYAHWNGASWDLETVDSAGNTGQYTSLVFDNSSKPAISYYDWTNGDLKYAQWNGSSWNIETVDSAGNVGDGTSLAFDTQGNPAIAYYDYTNHDLKYASGLAFSGSVQSDFQISVSPSYQNITQSSSSTTTVSIRSTNGYSNTVTLSAAGQPTDVQISFNPNGQMPSFSSTMTIQAGPTVAPGVHIITVNGTGSDGKSHSTTFTLTITASHGSLWSKSPLNPITSFPNIGGSLVRTDAKWRYYYWQADGIYLAESLDGLSWTNIGKVLAEGVSNDACNYDVGAPWVILDGSTFKMWYNGGDGISSYICYATSSDGLTWIRQTSPVVSPSSSGWGSTGVSNPRVLKDGSAYKMYASGLGGIGLLTSSDGINWTKHSGNPVLAGTSGGWDSTVYQGTVRKDGSTYRMWYNGGSSIGLATSSDGISWAKYSGNPVLTPGSSGSWDAQYVDAYQVLVVNGQYRMYYGGYGAVPSNQYLGFATSSAPADANDTIPAEPSTIDFNISVSPASKTVAQGASATATVSVNSINGYNNTVLLSANGQLGGVQISFTPNNQAPNLTSMMTVNVGANVSTGTYMITVTGAGSDGKSHSTQFTLTVVSRDFYISLSPTSLNITKGSSGTVAVSVRSINGYNNTIALSASGQPVGVQMGFNPNAGTLNFTSTMTIEVGLEAASGPYNITVNGTGSDGKTHLAALYLKVVEQPSYPLTISGMKFNDLNGNHVKDAGEPGLSGWIINLRNTTTNALIASTVTGLGGNYSFANLGAGAYKVCEVLQAGWNQTFPTSGASCNGDSEGSIGYSVSSTGGQNATGIDFGNLRLGTIIIVKSAIGGDGKFDFTSTGSDGLPSSFNITTAGGLGNRSFTVASGNYSLFEVSPIGWALVNSTCTSGTPAGFSVFSGGTVTCTFTNTKQGSIVVVKNTVGGDGSFNFTSTGSGGLPSSFDITTNEGTGNRIFIALAGNYSVSEIVPAGWKLANSSCTSGAPSSFTLLSGGTVTCTFVNKKLGTIVVGANSTSGDRTFSFATTGGGLPANFTITTVLGTGMQTFINLDPDNVYTMFESVPSGWRLKTITCVDITGDTSKNLTTASATIRLAPGETVICSFSNVKQLTSLGPVKAWVGLKNSDDVGTFFDLRAEVYLNGTLVGSGELNYVKGGSSGFNNAKANLVNLTLLYGVGDSHLDVAQGSSLSVKLYVRNTAFGKTHNSGTARLWYNDAQADSNFASTIGNVTSTNYLLNGYALGNSPGAGPKQYIDIAAGSPGSPFKLFGEWSTVMT